MSVLLTKSSNTVWMIKLRRMTLETHVAYIVEMRNAYRVLVGRSEGRPFGIPWQG
jgi:hypothetical protein